MLTAFIYSNKPLVRIARHATFWIGRIFIVCFLVAVWNYWPASEIFANSGKSFGWRSELILVTELPYCYFVNYYLVPKYFAEKSFQRFLPAFILVTLGDLLLYYLCRLWFQGITFSQVDFGFLISKPQNFIFEGPPACCFVFLAIKTFKRMQIEQVRATLLIKENAEAELQLMRAQVQPHFLFNTINNIYSFTLTRSHKAKEMITDLQNILRYTLNDCSTGLVELPKEIDMLQHYIDLEKIRYGNRLEMQMTIEGMLHNKSIAPLLLIPFVENSFKHGASRMLKNPWITLHIQADEDVLHFSLANGRPPESEKASSRSGIGLDNVRKRLELLYPGKYLLTIESTHHTYSVYLRVPIYSSPK